MPSIQILFFSNQFQCIIPQFHKSLTNFNISYKIQHQTLTIHSLDFFFSNPNLIHFFLNFYQIHHDSTLNTPIGVLSTKPQQIKGLCDLSTKTLGLEQTNLHRKTLAIIPITLDIQKTLDSIPKKKKTYICSSPSSPSSSSSLLLPFLLHTGDLAFVRQKKKETFCLSSHFKYSNLSFNYHLVLHLSRISIQLVLFLFWHLIFSKISHQLL